MILGGRGPGSAVAEAWGAEAPFVWAAILLVVVIDRRDGMECLVGVLEWLLGIVFSMLFRFIEVDLMLSSDRYDVRLEMVA